MQITSQEKIWSGNFGDDYTKRNSFEIDQLNKLYLENYGFSREDMNTLFLSNISKESKILEVGTNSGNQLLLLQKMGFKNLYGIEINQQAVQSAKLRCKRIDIINGSSFDIPFKDNFFDLVYTSGVLIHISPDNLMNALSEIYRCSNKYIWGFEYFSEQPAQVEYRGNNNLMWKMDYAKFYTQNFPDLAIEKEKHYKYIVNKNVDSMFLLSKQDKL